MRSRPAKKTPMEMNKCATGLKTSLVALFALTAIISAAIARDAVQIPSGTYLQFPDVVTGNLSFDGSRGSYVMGRYGACTIIKQSLQAGACCTSRCGRRFNALTVLWNRSGVDRI
jgi:hypothetical protein